MFAAPRRTDAAEAYRRERRSRPASAPAAGPGGPGAQSRKRHTLTNNGDAGDADAPVVAAVRVTNRSGAHVAQRVRVSSVAELGVAQLRVRHPDEESSEWLSEWGDAPEGPSGFGPSKVRPGWKGGGEAPGPSDGRFRALPSRASRPRPVPLAPRVSDEPDSLGIAGVEAKLRRWLVTNRRVHEPRRLTLLRMLGRGLASPNGGPGADSGRSVAAQARTHGDEYGHGDE